MDVSNGFNLSLAQHGTGFVGSAVLRAVHETCPLVRVIGVDPNQQAIHTLQELYGLPAVTPDAASAYEEFSIHSFSVPTPADEKSPWGYQLTYLVEALRNFGNTVLRNRDDFTLVIIRSTVYPGTTEKILVPVLEEASGKQCGREFDVAYNPEFLAQETAYEDALDPPVIAAACQTTEGFNRFTECFRPFGAPIERLRSAAEAEWLKLSNNVANAMWISCFNEIRECMRRDGLSAERAEYIARLQAATLFVKAKPEYGLRDMGPFGGACLPKETAAMLTGNKARGYPTRMLRATLEMNQAEKRRWQH